MSITWDRQTPPRATRPAGHEVACIDGGWELTILDLGGVFGWQIAQPTPGHGGFIEGGQVHVVKGDRERAREQARAEVEAAFAQHLAYLAELEEL